MPKPALPSPDGTPRRPASIVTAPTNCDACHLTQALADAGRLNVHMERSVAAIEDGATRLSCGTELATDHIIVCAGGTMPTGLLDAAGARVAKHFGRPHAP